ncbi:MAG: folate-binding protein, partial [Gallionella sp.]
MNPDWHNFLAQHGALIEAGVVQHFGDIAAELNATEKNTVFCDLSQFGRLRVAGEDSQSFLQNLLSNDIHEVSSARAQLSSFNTAKGRMLATMLIWREGDGYLLQIPRVLCETVRKKLSMYVLRAKVKIADAGDEFISLGLSGTSAQEVLLTQFGELPQSSLGVISTAQGSAIKISGTRWQINTSASHSAALWSELGRHAQPVGSICWDWLNIRSGIPVILP